MGWAKNKKREGGAVVFYNDATPGGVSPERTAETHGRKNMRDDVGDVHVQVTGHMST